MVANGLDPRAEDKARLAGAKKDKREAADRLRLEGELAFENVADRWLDHYEHEKQRRPASVRQAKLVVENHLKPALSGKPLPYIGRTELQPVIDAIPAKQKGMRRAVFAYTSILFGWAARRGDIPANPLTDMEKPLAPSPRDRVLNDEELRKLRIAARDMHGPFGAFFRLLILTGQRRSEVAGIDWEELDRAAATWTVPAKRAKNDTAHIVPLSGPVMAELDQLAGSAPDSSTVAQWPSNGLILTTTGKTPISGISKAKLRLDAIIAEANSGVSMPNWRIHDIRRTVATGFQRLGVRYEVTEAALNHISGAKGGVAGVYQRHDWKEEKRAALEAWSGFVSRLETGEEKNNVVSLDAAKKSA
jgi:integrase